MRNVTETPKGDGRLHGRTARSTAKYGNARRHPEGVPVSMDQTVLAGKPAKKLLTVCRCQIIDMPKELRCKFFEIGRMVQEATNLFWMRWIADAMSRNKHTDLRIFLELYARWKTGCKQGDKPKLEFNAIDAEFVRNASQWCAEAYPYLHSRCRALLLNSAAKRLMQLPSHTRSSLKLWQAVLLGAERPCCSDESLPIPFDGQNGTLTGDESSITLTVRVDRFEVTGKINGASTPDSMRLELPCNDKFRRLLLEAVREQRKWAGSQIVYQTSRRRWYAMIAVELDANPALPTSPTKSAMLSAPKEKCCWRLRFNDGSTVEIGSGRRIEHLRRRLATEKAVRRADPFQAPSCCGHGRKRLLRGMRRLTGRWGRVTKTLNQQAVARIVKELVSHKCDALDYVLAGSDCLLNSVGKEFGPTWPLYQIRENLTRKCAEQGIVLRIFENESDVSVATDCSSDVCDVSIGEIAG